MDWRVNCSSCLGNFKIDKDLPTQSTSVTPFKPSYCFKAQREEDISASSFSFLFLVQQRGGGGRDRNGFYCRNAWRVTRMAEVKQNARDFIQVLWAMFSFALRHQFSSQHLLLKPPAGTSAPGCAHPFWWISRRQCWVVALLVLNFCLGETPASDSCVLKMDDSTLRWQLRALCCNMQFMSLMCS